ncbi:MAG: hypothetical protein EOP39_16785 [Rubrivivax sp.]|nr:MAG: hypothetical protein EOP39_16785 [Rubrivivax sp.]
MYRQGMHGERVIDRPQLLDYVVFFETEPEWLHPDGWFYGARFSTHRDEDRITVTVAPDNAEFSLAWWQADRLRLRLNAVFVTGWRLDPPGGAVERLCLTLSDDPFKSCILQLRPHLQIEFGDSWG